MVKCFLVKHRKLFKKILIAVLVLFILAAGFIYRVSLKEAFYSFFKPALPEPKTAVEFPVGSSSDFTGIGALALKPLVPLPDSANLSVQFASQAPHSNWDMPYQEACEEATAIMVNYYFSGENLTAEVMDREILDLVKWQEKTFGYYKDTTADEIGRIMKEYFHYKNVEIKYDFSIEDIKREVADGNPVILPAAGRLLKNPNFKQPGPIYHALVVKGYTKDGKIITNDPGTRKGRDYIYDPDVLMNALHEWNAEDILKGRQAMIIVGP